jgi:hypothetical protein
MTHGIKFPAILNILGYMSNKPVKNQKANKTDKDKRKKNQREV